MKQEELDKILEKHKLWLDDEENGERADLRSADLRSANLRYANLRYADLSYANLRSANLRYADLRYANLRSADLSSADLHYANLRSADLSSADLSSADLRYANLRSANLRSADLRSANLSYAGLIGITAPIWNIYVNCETTQIGCESYTNEEWRKFKDSRIKLMDIRALDWWKLNKQMVLAAMDAVNAQPEPESKQ